jgi:hypothetical protein
MLVENLGFDRSAPSTIVTITAPPQFVTSTRAPRYPLSLLFSFSSHRLSTQSCCERKGHSSVDGGSCEWCRKLRIAHKEVGVQKGYSKLSGRHTNVTQNRTRSGIVQGTFTPVDTFHRTLKNVVEVQSTNVHSSKTWRQGLALCD